MNAVQRIPVVFLTLLVLTCQLGTSSCAADRQRVVATIGRHKVTAAEVDVFLGRSAKDGELPQRTRDYALAILAKQKRALESMRKLGLAADGKAVDAWMDRQAEETPSHQSSAAWLTSIAQEAEVPEFVVRENIAFRLSWKAYLAKHLTAKNVAKHFSNQQARFDGTLYDVERVAVVTPVGESSVRTRAGEVLAAVRGKLIHRGDSPLDASAIQDSEYDFSDQGIELAFSSGEVKGSEEIDTAIVDAILATPEMEWSSPVDTLVGVHILRVRKVAPGALKYEAAKSEVRAHLLIFLLDYLAEKSSDNLPLRLAD